MFDFNSGKVGVSKAKELAFTARMINGEEAANLGLVNRCGKYNRLVFNNRSSLKQLCGLKEFLFKVPGSKKNERPKDVNEPRFEPVGQTKID